MSSILIQRIIIICLIIFAIYIFTKKNGEDYRNDLLNGESVDLLSLDTKILRRILNIDIQYIELNKSNISYYMRERRDYRELNNILEKNGINLSDLESCVTAEIEEGKKTPLECNSFDSSTSLHSYITNNCYVVFGERDFDEDEEYTLGDIICNTSNKFSRLFTRRCEAVGYSFECIGEPGDPPSKENLRIKDTLSEKTHTAIATILSSKVDNTWRGYRCKADCSGHKAGYNWAKKNSVKNRERCHNQSISFKEGCISYIKNI